GFPSGAGLGRAESSTSTIFPIDPTSAKPLPRKLLIIDESSPYSGRFGSQIANLRSRGSLRVSLSNYKLGRLKKLGKFPPAGIGPSSKSGFWVDIWHFVGLLDSLGLIYTPYKFHAGVRSNVLKAFDPRWEGPPCPRCLHPHFFELLPSSDRDQKLAD